MTNPKSAMKTRIWMKTRKLFWLATHQMTRLSSSLTLIINPHFSLVHNVNRD